MESFTPKAPITTPYKILLNKGETPKSINVCLQEPIPEEDLKELSKHIFQETKTPETGFVYIFYYLPGMIIDNGAWAVGKFKPFLEIDITGFNQKKQYLSLPVLVQEKIKIRKAII